MKNAKLIFFGILMGGVMLTFAQQPNAVATDALQRKQDSAAAAEASTKAVEQAVKIGVAADYLKMALVLGLGMLIGRMSAISHRELTELKAVVARLANHSTATTNEIKIRDA